MQITVEYYSEKPREFLLQNQQEEKITKLHGYKEETIPISAIL